MKSSAIIAAKSRVLRLVFCESSVSCAKAASASMRYTDIRIPTARPMDPRVSSAVRSVAASLPLSWISCSRTRESSRCTRIRATNSRSWNGLTM
ncbi:hypothetical protein CH256_00820 [Rhodococcus sp. 05-2254-6]|nr:hypothetical protein CH256_00820 [Rhodococcus sp. 05-2254-6]